MALSVVAPRWDVSRLFPSVESPELAAAEGALTADLDRLSDLYDQFGVRGTGPAGPPTEADVAVFEEVVTATNALLDQSRALSAYLLAIVTTEARNEMAASRYSRLQPDLARLQKLTTRFDAWVGRLGPDALIDGSPAAATHAHALRQAAVSAAHQMTEPEESLYADLRLTGSSAWKRLHDDVTALLLGSLDGQVVPVTTLRGMATNPEPAVRKAAFDAEVAAWRSAEVPLAAALNAIKGEMNTVNERRRWPDALGASLHLNGVERSALSAMQAAATMSFPDFRRYLKAKARLLGGQAALAWWDLFAPVPGEVGVSWTEAAGAVEAAFESYSPELAGLARRAQAERWIDAEAREGKQGGAYCVSVGRDESLVFLNFDGSSESAQSLAHELGHAYHNTQLAERSPLQRRTPMALAETASIFCETIMVQARLSDASVAERLTLLNVDLQGACQVVVDIHSRFLFEQDVFSRREKGTLSPRELVRIMTDAQLATFGDGLDQNALHPYMWAVKPHYYSSTFYNWPYCFGLLFGLGLYARYEQDPDRFRAGYDDLLSSTGLAPAAELAGRFGIDLASEDFWTASLDVLRSRIEEFELLADGWAARGSNSAP
jgi:pepF/M3 family oligoendopeptidase